MPEFKPFPKIPRLRKTIIITEKIDGTNASITVTEDGDVFAGKRTSWITAANDNYGFAKWVEDNVYVLRDGLGVGTHYGEWWGQGIQRRYGLTEKRFSLFNVNRWKDAVPPLCHLVPVLYEGDWNQNVIENTLWNLKYAGSTAAAGFMKPEGIVIFHSASGQLYKVTLDNDQHKT